MLDLPLDSAVWLSAGCTMAHFVCLGAVLGLLASAARRILLCGSPEQRYLLTLACLALLAVSPAVLWPWIVSRVDSADTADPIMAVQAGDDEAALAAWPENPFSATSPQAVSPRSADFHLLAGRVIHGAAGRLLRWISIRGPFIWLCGLAGMLLVTVAGLVGLRRICAHARPEAGAVQKRADALCSSLRLRPIPVKLSDAIFSPLLVGWSHPVVLLPAAAHCTWTPEQVELVLLHELTHARRLDNFVNLLQRASEILFFFNPAVWYLSRCVRLDREEVCDRAVLARTGRRVAYAELLFSLASFPATSPMAAAMGEHNLVLRIRRILDHECPLRRSRRGVISAGAALLAASSGMAVFHVISTAPLPRVPESARDPSRPFPAAHRSPHEELPRAGAQDENGTSFILLDDSGRPVQGALVSTNVRLQNATPVRENGVGRSNAVGSVSSPLALKRDAMTQFYFYHPDRHLVGAAGLFAAGSNAPVPVVLWPACRLRVELQIPGSDEVSWTKCFIRMADLKRQSSCRVNDLYLLRQTQSSAAGGPWIFKYELPPGRYELLGMGGNEAGQTLTIPQSHCFEVVAGMSDLDLGTIQVPLKPAAMIPPENGAPQAPAGEGGRIIPAPRASRPARSWGAS